MACLRMLRASCSEEVFQRGGGLNSPHSLLSMIAKWTNAFTLFSSGVISEAETDNTCMPWTVFARTRRERTVPYFSLVSAWKPPMEARERTREFEVLRLGKVQNRIGMWFGRSKNFLAEDLRASEILPFGGARSLEVLDELIADVGEIVLCCHPEE